MKKLFLYHFINISYGFGKKMFSVFFANLCEINMKIVNALVISFHYNIMPGVTYDSMDWHAIINLLLLFPFLVNLLTSPRKCGDIFRKALNDHLFSIQWCVIEKVVLFFVVSLYDLDYFRFFFFGRVDSNNGHATVVNATIILIFIEHT